jgi:hypothetical protein
MVMGILMVKNDDGCFNCNQKESLNPLAQYHFIPNQEPS